MMVRRFGSGLRDYDADMLPGKWVLTIYAAMFVPYVGPPAVIAASSVLYYAWRRKRPRAARAVNRHAWIALGVSIAVQLLWFAWHRAFSKA